MDNFKAYNGYGGINIQDVRLATLPDSRLYTGDDRLAGAYWENNCTGGWRKDGAFSGTNISSRGLSGINAVRSNSCRFVFGSRLPGAVFAEYSRDDCAHSFAVARRNHGGLEGGTAIRWSVLAHLLEWQRQRSKDRTVWPQRMRTDLVGFGDDFQEFFSI